MYKFFKHSMLIGIIGAAVNLFLFLTNLFYKLVVPAIENSGIEGQTFKFLDDLIYYTPVILMVLFIAYLIAGQIYLKKHHVEHENKLNEKNDEKNGPQKTLRGFKRVTIPAGQTVNVTLPLTDETFNWWDNTIHTVHPINGAYTLLVGSSSADEDLQQIAYTF